MLDLWVLRRETGQSCTISICPFVSALIFLFQIAMHYFNLWALKKLIVDFYHFRFWKMNILPILLASFTFGMYSEELWQPNQPTQISRNKRDLIGFNRLLYNLKKEVEAVEWVCYSNSHMVQGPVTRSVMVSPLVMWLTPEYTI